MQTAADKVSAIINVTPLIDVLLVLLITFMILPIHRVVFLNAEYQVLWVGRSGLDY